MSSDAMKITLCEPSMTDGAIKMRVIKSLARKIRGKIFAKCCGYPSCPPPSGVSQAYCSLDWAAAAAVKALTADMARHEQDTARRRRAR